MHKVGYLRLPIPKIGDVVLEMPLGARLVMIGTQKSSMSKLAPESAEGESPKSELFIAVEADPNEKRKVFRKIRTVIVKRPVRCHTPPKGLISTTQIEDGQHAMLFDGGLSDSSSV
jgi:hypothetical protein